MRPLLSFLVAFLVFALVAGLLAYSVALIFLPL
jgi:hypothetical protein